MTVPNFWWQLGELSLLVSLTLFCGWLQGYFNWAPEEIEINPAPAGHGHGHHHHGHDHAHAPNHASSHGHGHETHH
jgi:hypothetical protein